MKTAISIPDELFEQAEELADRLRISRSRLYALAVADYMARHRSKAVRRKLDEVYGERSAGADEALSIMQGVSIPREEW